MKIREKKDAMRPINGSTSSWSKYQNHVDLDFKILKKKKKKSVLKEHWALQHSRPHLEVE